ncbi:MAG: serine hydrolase [Pseudomonadota bacterium]
MRNSISVRAALLILLSQGALAHAETEDDFDYFSNNRGMIRNGVQAVLSCNGLFTSNRSLQQVLEQELAYLQERVGGPATDNYRVDNDLQLVSVGGGDDGEEVQAVFRPGIGCVVLGPEQSAEDIPDLPSVAIAPPKSDPSETAWPDGDLLADRGPGGAINAEMLQAASDWAFKRETDEQDTLSLLVVHKGQIVHERYAEGVDMHTRTRTWSTAKSIAVSLIGILVEQGKMKLDESLGIEWLPALDASEADPRDEITLRHALNMASGLYPVDSFGMEYATGSGLAYWAGASSVAGARKRGLVREPGSFWDYENYDTLLAVYAMKQVFADEAAYHQFPYRALLSKIGMHNTLLSTDRFGDFILSSQVYTNARDLARFGLLYLQDGVWQGERILSKEWIDFVRTPAPATSERGKFYGGQWWLVPDDREDVPKDAYATAGNRGQYLVVVPSHDLVIVRRGLDYGKQGFNRWDLTREVLKAFND